MRRYLVSYDLLTPGKDYQALGRALARLGAKKVLYSQWVVELDGTSAPDLRDHLLQFMDANDRILVVDITGVAMAWRGLMTRPVAA